MDGGLIDGETLRRALGAMTFGQGMVLVGRLAGLSDEEMAEALGVRESDVRWIMESARSEVARMARDAVVLLDSWGVPRDGAAHRDMGRLWRERLNGGGAAGGREGA